ncbi:hypothetical protein IAU60_006859 [Kwoniella sp. DSM 27419]
MSTNTYGIPQSILYHSEDDSISWPRGTSFADSTKHDDQGQMADPDEPPEVMGVRESDVLAAQSWPFSPTLSSMPCPKTSTSIQADSAPYTETAYAETEFTTHIVATGHSTSPVPDILGLGNWYSYSDSDSERSDCELDENQREAYRDDADCGSPIGSFPRSSPEQAGSPFYESFWPAPHHAGEPVDAVFAPKQPSATKPPDDDSDQGSAYDSDESNTRGTSDGLLPAAGHVQEPRLEAIEVISHDAEFDEASNDEDGYDDSACSDDSYEDGCRHLPSHQDYEENGYDDSSASDVSYEEDDNEVDPYKSQDNSPHEHHDHEDTDKEEQYEGDAKPEPSSPVEEDVQAPTRDATPDRDQASLLTTTITTVPINVDGREEAVEAHTMEGISIKQEQEIQLHAPYEHDSLLSEMSATTAVADHSIETCLPPAEPYENKDGKLDEQEVPIGSQEGIDNDLPTFPLSMVEISDCATDPADSIGLDDCGLSSDEAGNDIRIRQHERTDSCSSISSAGPVTPISSAKRSLPGECAFSDNTGPNEPAGMVHTDLATDSPPMRPIKRMKRIGSAIGFVMLGAAIGSVGTIAGLMQLAE